MALKPWQPWLKKVAQAPLELIHLASISSVRMERFAMVPCGVAPMWFPTPWVNKRQVERSRVTRSTARSRRGSASSASSGEARAEARAVSKQTLGIFSHLTLTLRLLWSKWSKSKRSRRSLTPLPRFFPWRFRQDLRRKGCGVVRIPSAAVEPLQRIAQEYLTREFPQFSPETAKPKLRGQGRKSVDSIEAQGSTATESTESTGSFFRADGLNAAFPSSMSWHWASDAATLEVFAKAGQHVLRFLGDDFALVAASLVVASGDCTDDLSKFHLDFGPPKIPRGVAATALMPLWPDRFPFEGHLAPWLKVAKKVAKLAKKVAISIALSG